MDFQKDDAVLWHGSPCRVIEVRGERVALSRDSDDYTVLTTSDVLEAHQIAAQRRRAMRQ